MKNRVPVLVTLLGGSLVLPMKTHAETGCYTSTSEHTCEVKDGPVDCSCSNFLAQPGHNGVSTECSSEYWEYCNPLDDGDGGGKQACEFSGDSCSQEPGLSGSW
jgi:hypothetical protein